MAPLVFFIDDEPIIVSGFEYGVNLLNIVIIFFTDNTTQESLEMNNEKSKHSINIANCQITLSKS